MLDLIKYVVKQFAEFPDKVDYVVEEKEDSIEVTIALEESDMGKVIGRQGKIAKALRTLVKAGTKRGEKKYNIEIKSRAEVQ
ncbi:MAG: KH domain-containing protein [Clostridia bacterium]|nr:KH domain-containing protein [Clostridia bacterium]